MNMPTVLYYKDKKNNKVPILTGDSSSFTSAFYMDEDFKKSLLRDFPEIKNNLYMHIDGTDFKIDPFVWKSNS